MTLASPFELGRLDIVEFAVVSQRWLIERRQFVLWETNSTTARIAIEN
jgi:hypothetical protein